MISTVDNSLGTFTKHEVSASIEACDRKGRSQHCFDKGRPCLTNLLEVHEMIKSKINKGVSANVVYLDFQKKLY